MGDLEILSEGIVNSKAVVRQVKNGDFVTIRNPEQEVITV